MKDINQFTIWDAESSYIKFFWIHGCSQLTILHLVSLAVRPARGIVTHSFTYDIREWKKDMSKRDHSCIQISISAYKTNDAMRVKKQINSPDSRLISYPIIMPLSTNYMYYFRSDKCEKNPNWIFKSILKLICWCIETISLYYYKVLLIITKYYYKV